MGFGGNPLAQRWTKLYRGTFAEAVLEPAVAALGVPYRTQFPLWLFEGGLRYFVDFALPTLGLVIEVDDPSHQYKIDEDTVRSAAIADAHNWRVLRCTNDEAVRDPIGTVNRLMTAAGVPNRVSPGTALPRGRWLPLPASAAARSGKRPSPRRSAPPSPGERTPDRVPSPCTPDTSRPRARSALVDHRAADST